MAVDTLSTQANPIPRNHSAMEPEQFEGTQRLVVFGYGSLIWKPNFAYQKRSVGFIRGYLRRFYQGNTVHRGTRDRPGRVATLIPAEQSDARVWGCAYHIIGQNDVQAALEHLNQREVINGGYEFTQTDFFPIRPDVTEPRQLKAWICVHNTTSNIHTSDMHAKMSCTDNPPNLYLGKAPLDSQAAQIASARGSCGSNSEYVFRIARFMRTEVPTAHSTTDDPNLFILERLIRNRLARDCHG